MTSCQADKLTCLGIHKFSLYLQIIKTTTIKTMKKAILTLVILVMAITAQAQFNDYLEVTREVIKTEKKAMIAEVMQLSEEKSKVFWPLYNEFQEKLYIVNTKAFNLIQDFAANYGNMSAEKATELLKAAMAIDQERLKVEKTFFKKFQKILSPQKTLRYYQAENKIETMINSELASEIPLLEAIED